MEERLDRFQEILENGLVKVCGMSGIQLEMMTSPDIDDKWNDVLLKGYTADAVNNVNDYPQAALGFAAYLGMAVANQWDTDWNSFRDVPYASYYGNRGFDDMDDHIVDDVLRLDSLIADKIRKTVLNCTQATQDLLRHEGIETRSEFGFYILVRCYSALFRIGVSLELHRLGYRKTALTGQDYLHQRSSQS